MGFLRNIPILGSIFSPVKLPPTVLPPPAPAPVAPDVDEEALRRERKKATAAASRRSGRMSTILTDSGGEKLGS